MKTKICGICWRKRNGYPCTQLRNRPACEPPCQSVTLRCVSGSQSILSQIKRSATLAAMHSATEGASCASNGDLSADEIVSKVLLCRHSFQVFDLDPPRAIELSDLQRQYRQLALRLHPDKNPSEAAQSAFIRLADAFEELKDPLRQKTLLLRLHRAKGGKAASQTHEAHGARQEAAAPAQAREGGSRQRSFMDVMREWEEFEKEYESTVRVEDELQRQIRQEKKRSRQADRAEREQAERAALESVLEEDLEGRTSSWNSFLTGKKGHRKKKSTPLSARGGAPEPGGAGGSGSACTVGVPGDDSASRPKAKGRWGALDDSLPPRIPSYPNSDT